MSEIKNNKSVDLNFGEEAGVRGKKSLPMFFFTPKTYKVITVSCYLIRLSVRCDSSITPKSQKCAFLKSLLFLIKNISIKN